MIQESIFGIAAALAGIAYAVWCAAWAVKQPEGEEALRVPYLAIREGATAFMRTQYSVIGTVAAGIFVILWAAPGFGLLTAIGFAIGALCSAASGAIGMSISGRAHVRTPPAAEHWLARALHVALRSRPVTGFLGGGLAPAGPWRRSSRWGSPSAWTTSRTSSPVASNSESRSRGPSSPTRR